MVINRRVLAALAAVWLALSAIAPVWAQDDGVITLVPFTSETFGLEGVIPDGWTEAAPGVYARGAGMTDLTSVLIQAAPGMTSDALAGVLLQQLGLEALPESSGTLETEAFTWTLYAISVEQMGMSIKVDLAFAEDDAGVTLVLLQTLADEYEALHDAVFLPVVEALNPLGEGTDAAERVVYEDPSGSFSVPVPTNWDVETREGYAYLYAPDELITVSILVVDTADPQEALDEAWAVVDPGFDKTLSDTSEIPAQPLEQFVLYTYEMADDEDFIYQVEVRVYEGRSYVLIFKANLTEAQQRQAQLQIIDSGFEITAIEQTDLSTAEPLPLTDELIASFEAYIQEAMETYRTPGAAVAIVRDGEIVYANGFGVRNPQGDPVTPETRMLIGSTTKTMTTLLMAQMVDAGAMDWTTPVVEILPTFEVADPDVTPTLTMENMVCACTGVPRRDYELIFNSDELSAEAMIESLATFEFFTEVGEAFQYSNQMVAAGGYLAALAAGGEYGMLYEAYVRLLEENIFGPLGMESTTFSFEEALASDNYALPYGLFLDFTFRPISFEIEEAFLNPVTPAGAAWSNVLDMAQYMIMQLNEGVAADGTRIVSAENLAHTWEPQVAISASDDYGLGWIVSDINGLRMLSHAGNTLGFTSEFAFLPDHDLGVVVLTNQRVSLLNTAIRGWLFETLFEQPHTTDESLQFSLEQMTDQFEGLQENLDQTGDPEVAAQVVGTFTNDALGTATVSLNADGVLIFDAGEFQSELWVYTAESVDDAEDTETFILYEPPLNGLEVSFAPDGSGVYQMTVGSGVTEYAFERVE